MDEYTTTAEALLDRLYRSITMYEVYCAGVRDGQGLPDTTPHTETMEQLLWMLRQRHRADNAPPRLLDELPGYLLSQRQQTETAPLRGVMQEGKP